MNDRFKMIVKTTGLKYIDFAKDMGWGEQKVKFLANGRQNITPDIALELEEKFGIDPCWLIFGRGNMYPPKMSLDDEAIKTDDEINDTLKLLKQEIADIKKEQEKLTKLQ